MNRRLTICLIAVLLSVSACSTVTDAANNQSATEEPADAPGATGVSPDAPNAFDIFLREEIGLIKYAQSTLVGDCMADRGYPQMSQLPDSGPQQFDSVFVDFDLDLIGPMTEEQAREEGFGSTPAPQPPSIINNDPSMDAADEECRAEVEDVLREDTQSTLDAYTDLENQVYAAFASRLVEGSEFRDALGGLVDCASDNGFPPDDREALLNDLEWSHFGVEFGQVVFANEGDTPTYEPGTVEVIENPSGADYQPTSEEVEFALVWVECRTTTGFDDVVGPLISRIKSEVVAEYETQFLELNPRIEELARLAAEATG